MYSRTQRRMIRTLTCPVLMGVVPLLGAGGALAADPPPRPMPSLQAAHHPGRVLVRFKPGVLDAAKTNADRAAGVNRTLHKYRHVSDLKLVEVPAVEAAIKSYLKDPNVLYAEPDYQVQAVAIPNDSYFNQQWGLQNTGQTVNGDTGTSGADIRATQAWDVWKGSSTFKVAVIDTGVDYTHTDLVNNIWTNPHESLHDANSDGCPGVCGVDDDGDGQTDETPEHIWGIEQASWDDDENGWADDIHGYNFWAPWYDPMDDQRCVYHGTHVAGIIGAVANNAAGVAGINWNIKIVALKFLAATGQGFISDAVTAMEYCIVNNIKLSNNSWGCRDCYSQSLYDVIEASQSIGHIFVAAAGNNGLDIDVYPFYPAGYDLPNIISVAATDNDDHLATFYPIGGSNYGLTSVDIGAPGLNIYSTKRCDPSLPPDWCQPCQSGGWYQFLSGTSMAAPHVTGVVALVMSRSPSCSFETIKDRIVETARPVAALSGITVSGGVVNAQAALTDCSVVGFPGCATDCCVIGACCTIAGSCTQKSACDCTGFGHSFVPGVSCKPNPCGGGGE